MKITKQTVRLVAVAYCAECPFSYDGDGDWACTAVEDKDGHYKTIAEVQKPRGGSWLPPPKWCPLRTEILVVTLAKGT